MQEDMSSSFIYDSQDSSDDDNQIFQQNLKLTSNTILSDSSDSNSDVDSILNIDIEGDPIFAKINTKKRPLNEDDFLKINNDNDVKVIKIKQFDLGNEYDSNINKNLEIIKSSTNINDELLTNTKSENVFISQVKHNTSELLSALHSSSLRKHENIKYYIDVIVNEKVSSKYTDWYFFVQDTKITDIKEVISTEDYFLMGNDWHKLKALLLQQYPSIDIFLMNIGVSNSKLKSLKNEKTLLTKERTYDPLAKLLPFNMVMQLISFYSHENSFLPIYLAILLDRNCYELTIFNDQLIQKTIQLFSDHQIMEAYLILVSKNDYFMHNRFTRVFPKYKNLLMEELWVNDNESKDKTYENIASEFNNLYDNSNYSKLLYFILFVYGSNLIPFKNSHKNGSSLADNKNIQKIKEYFENCINDSVGLSINEVELPLIKNIIVIFNKIT